MRRRTFLSPARPDPLQPVQPMVQAPSDELQECREAKEAYDPPHEFEDDLDDECSEPLAIFDSSPREELAMHGCLVAVIFLSLLLICLFGGKSPSSLLHIEGIKDLIESTPRTRNGEFIVFLTRSSGERGGTHIAMGKSKASPKIALSKAAAKLPREAHSYNWVKVDVVVGIAHKDSFDHAKEKPDMSEWWYGVGLDWEKGWVFLPDEVYSRALIDSDETLRWDHIIKLAHEKNLKGWPSLAVYNHGAEDSETKSDDTDATKIQIDFFQTKAVFCDMSELAPGVIQLYHGHRMHPSLDSNLLTNVAKEAGKYLSRTVTDSGEMLLSYKPRSDMDSHGYSKSSHAGATFSMALLYHTWKDPTLHRSITKSLDWLVDQTEPCPLPYDSKELGECIVDQAKDGTKFTLLEVNSLSLLALSVFMDASKDASHFTAAKGIAQWICGAQRHEGSFVQKQSIDENELDEDMDVASPLGLAIFSLSRLHNTVKRMGLEIDPAWSDAAIKAVDFVVAREAKLDDNYFTNDSWMMYGVAEMRLWHMNERIVDFAMRGVKISRDFQYGDTVAEDEDRDKFGIFYDDPSTTATATAAEGLCVVYDLAVEHGRVADEELILDAATLALRYTLQTQYRPEQAMYMKDPLRIIGAFSKSIYERQIVKSENTQHNLAGILCMAKLLEGLNKPVNSWR